MKSGWASLFDNEESGSRDHLPSPTLKTPVTPRVRLAPGPTGALSSPVPRDWLLESCGPQSATKPLVTNDRWQPGRKDCGELFPVLSLFLFVFGHHFGVQRGQVMREANSGNQENGRRKPIIVSYSVWLRIDPSCHPPRPPELREGKR